MPLTPTHALVPVAGTIAFAKRPVALRLAIVAAIAAAVPDLDLLSHWLCGLLGTSGPGPTWTHRGAAHSLFVALATGLVAATLHKRLHVRPLTAGVVVAAAMASHGLLDMFTNYGEPVAYLWPVSSVRLFADWRPIRSGPVDFVHLVSQGLTRFQSEMWQLIVPMFAIAIAVRAGRAGLTRIRARRAASEPR